MPSQAPSAVLQGAGHIEPQTQAASGPGFQPLSPYPKLPPHAILHTLRCEIERRHHDELFRHSVRFHGPPRVSLSGVSRMAMHEMESCCNKTVPLYIWPDTSCSREVYQLLLVVLHNYLYRTWFVPYRSEIDWGQFVAQVISLLDDTSLPSTLDVVSIGRAVAALSGAISTRIKTSQAKILDWETRNDPNDFGRHEALQVELGVRDWECVNSQTHLHVQPLFQAVAIVIPPGSYSPEIPNIADIPALLVITGVTEGLSAPITFDTIPQQALTVRYPLTDDGIQAAETTLGIALDFVKALEKRELAAVGPNPNPADTGKEPRRSWLLGEGEALFIASQYGWDRAEPPEGPSSSWVGLDIYKEWTGPGADYDRRSTQWWEMHCRKMVAAVSRGENPYVPL